MQQVAVSLLVLLITHSPFLMGVASLAQGLPRLLFALVGGVIADRVDRHRLLVACQASEMVLAFFFSLLVLTETIQFWHLLILLPIFGFLKSMYVISRQAYVFDLVGREDLMNALALHSSAMNLAKIIGPSIAGILIGIWGVGWCLFINGVSFIAILISFLMMHPPASSKKEHHSPSLFRDLGETFGYLKLDKPILILIIASFSFRMFGLQPEVILPLIADNVLKVGASGYGFLMGSMGLGAVMGGVTVAGLGNLKKKGYHFLITSLIYGCLLILFSFSPWFYVSLFLIFLVGIVDISSRTINQTLVQLLSPEKLRGRILGVFMLHQGLRPLGGFLMGAVASLFGAPLALASGAGICVFVASSLLFKSPRIRKL